MVASLRILFDAAIDLAPVTRAEFLATHCRDPVERAGDLAGDIEHHLAALSVRARPPSRWYRMHTFARCHRRGVAGGFIFMLALMAALAYALIQAAATRHVSQRASALRDFIVAAFSEAVPGAPRGDPPTVTAVERNAAARARADAATQPTVRSVLLPLLDGVLREQGAFGDAIAVLQYARASVTAQAGADAASAQASALGLLRAAVDTQHNGEARALAIRLLPKVPPARQHRPPACRKFRPITVFRSSHP